MNERPRDKMNGKPVVEMESKTIINFKSAFADKLLCDGLTFSTGTSCAYSCTYCYVRSLFARSPEEGAYKKALDGRDHAEVVVRRQNAVKVLRSQLLDAKGRPKFKDDRRTIYASPLVDVAANMDLVRETVDAVSDILNLTGWTVRLLSKSPLLVKVAEAFEGNCISETARSRIIYGLSTGTFDDRVGRAIEPDVPLPSKRVAALRQLQDAGFRTFAMVCPSLPQGQNYAGFARQAEVALHYAKCEHVWAEPINVRGDSFAVTRDALLAEGCADEAALLGVAMGSNAAWETYARETFFAHWRALHASNFPPDRLRFLQYVTPETLAHWKQFEGRGAVLLGKAAHAGQTA